MFIRNDRGDSKWWEKANQSEIMYKNFRQGMVIDINIFKTEKLGLTLEKDQELSKNGKNHIFSNIPKSALFLLGKDLAVLS